MADTPSSAPLFVRESQRFDEIAGWPSREEGTDPLIHAPGSHQFLGHQANHHDGAIAPSPHANRVIPGTLPKTSGPDFGAPDNVNPLGRRFMASLEGDNEDART